jgi:hypothetical protein
VDITPGKDGGILKEITTQGVVGDGPLLGDKVSKYYSMWVAKATFYYLYFIYCTGYL